MYKIILNKAIYKKSKFGWKFLCTPRRGEKGVKIFALIKSGAKNERKDSFGVAHFFEHMSAKGTGSAPTPLELSRRIEKIGGDFNPGTSYEYTIYPITVPKNKLQFGIKDLADRLKNSLLKPEHIEMEKGVILEEYKMYDDDPKSRVSETLGKIMFGENTGLGHRIEGSMETIADMNREKMVEFLKGTYKNENVILGVTGSVNPEKVFKMFEDEFGELYEKHNSDYKIEKEFEDSETNIAVISDTETLQTHFHIGFKTAGRNDKDRFVLKVMSIILGGTMSSRLFIQLRENHGLAYYLGSYSRKYEDLGYFGIYAGTEKSKFIKSLKLVINELKRFKDGKISGKDLSLAKSNTKGKLLISMDDPEFLWSHYASQYLFNSEEILSPDESLDKINSVSKEDIIRVAKLYFTPENFYISVTHDAGIEAKIERMVKSM